MAKRASAAQLRTRIQVFDVPDGDGSDKDGYEGAGAVNVFGAGRHRRCKWVNAHGPDVYEATRLGLEEAATLTMRYTPGITPTCVIYRGDDPRPYEVISINDVEDRHVWLEVRVRRKVAAK